jgi:hypothetical protein
MERAYLLFLLGTLAFRYPVGEPIFRLSLVSVLPGIMKVTLVNMAMEWITVLNATLNAWHLYLC